VTEDELMETFPHIGTDLLRMATLMAVNILEAQWVYNGPYDAYYHCPFCDEIVHGPGEPPVQPDIDQHKGDCIVFIAQFLVDNRRKYD